MCGISITFLHKVSSLKGHSDAKYSPSIQNNKALIGRHCIAQGDNPGMASDVAPINNNPEGVALHHTMSPLWGYVGCISYPNCNGTLPIVPGNMKQTMATVG